MNRNEAAGSSIQSHHFAVGAVLALALAVALWAAIAVWQAAPGEAKEKGPPNDPNATLPAGATTAPAADATPAVSLDRDASGNEYVAGELLVSYSSDGAERADKRAKQDQKAKVTKTFDEVDAQLVISEEVKGMADRAERERALAAAKERIEAQPGVKAVSYNYANRQVWTPNDYHWQPRSNNDGGQHQLRSVGAPAGWDYPNGRGAGVKIAVIDSGFDDAHPEFCTSHDAAGNCFGGKVVAQKDFLKDDPYADDQQFHGSAVASLAAARTNNRDGIAGAAPDAKLMIAKISDYRGHSTVADATEAVLWAANNGARVINMSFVSATYNQAFKDAIDYAYLKKNALPVCGAGNTGKYQTALYPAGYASCLAVGSSSGSRRSSFSSYGPYVDVVAPGENLLGATPLHTGAPYGTGMSGTSFSAPIVAGLAADVVSRKPSLTGPKIRAAIQRYADDLGPAGRDDQTGYGRVNFKRSISNAPGL